MNPNASAELPRLGDRSVFTLNGPSRCCEDTPFGQYLTDQIKQYRVNSKSEAKQTSQTRESIVSEIALEVLSTLSDQGISAYLSAVPAQTNLGGTLTENRIMVVIDPLNGKTNLNEKAKEMWLQGQTLLTIDPRSYLEDPVTMFSSRSFKKPLRFVTIPANILTQKELASWTPNITEYQLHSSANKKVRTEDALAAPLNPNGSYLAPKQAYLPFQAQGDLSLLNRLFDDKDWCDKQAPATKKLLLEQTPIFGTTQFVGVVPFQYEGQQWWKYVFHDTQTKEHTIALVKGDITRAKEVFTRIHSSCITSETLGALDCDCRDQLKKAMDIINEKGDGVLFYCVQEGRGAGYGPKARDRNSVQATGHKVSDLYETYEQMGLHGDIRDYRNVEDILKMFGFSSDPTSPAFTLISNNQTKLAALAKMGVRVKGLERVPEMEVGLYNPDYLDAKKRNKDHDVEHYGDIGAVPVELPPQMMIPAGPHKIGHSGFAVNAQYALPTSTYPGHTILTNDQYEKLLSLLSEKKGEQLALWESIQNTKALNNGFIAVPRDRNLFKAYREQYGIDETYRLLAQADWQYLQVVEDLVTKRTYVVMQYGQPSSELDPIVAFHTDSLDARLFIDKKPRKFYREAWKQIIDHGYGYIITAINDGQGSTLNAETLVGMQDAYLELNLPARQDFSRVERHLKDTRERLFVDSALLTRELGFGGQIKELILPEHGRAAGESQFLFQHGLTMPMKYI